MKPNRRYLIAGFLLGLLVGTAADRCLAPWRFSRRGPETRDERILKRFGSKLDLTPQQKDEIGAILKSRRQQIEALFSEVHPKFEAIRQSAGEEIRAKLTPEQQVTYDEMKKKRESRRKKYHRAWHP